MVENNLFEKMQSLLIEILRAVNSLLQVNFITLLNL